MKSRLEYIGYHLFDTIFIGTKSFVVNAADSKLFLVTAQTETNDRKGDKKNALSMFLVDSTLPGIKIQSKNETIGRTNLYQATIKFDNVILTKGGTLFQYQFTSIVILNQLPIRFDTVNTWFG